MTKPAIVAAVLFAAMGHQCIADLTYNTSPFTFDQDDFPGWSYAGGSITTNGFLGTVDNANINTVITGWSLTFTSTAFGTPSTYTLTEANSIVSYAGGNGGGTNLEITQTAIVFPSIPSTPTADPDQLQFFANTGDIFLIFEGEGQQNPSDPSFSPALTLFDTFAFAGSTEQYGPGLGNTIGVIPEPSGLLCIWAMAVCVSCRRIRR